MLQRRHYETIAQAVSRVVRENPHAHSRAFVHALAEELRCGNANFNRAKFVEACLKNTGVSA